ncbi:MAG: ATP-binding protein [Planctomycetota bacterium]
MGELRSPWRPSIATEFRILIGVLAAVLLGISGTVVCEVHAIRTDLRRAIEERREAEQAQALLLDLRGFERVVRLSVGVRSDADALLARDDQVAHLRGAAAALVELANTPHDDPSSDLHQQKEARELVGLRSGIDGALAATADGCLGGDWVERAGEMRTLAESLEHEVSREAHAASVDLDQHGGNLMRLVTLLALIGFLILLSVSAWVARGLVRPLRELAEGTRAIGRGRRGHVLPSRGGAEIADLGREITAMAHQLERHQRELQDRVEQRTHELVRSARLADLGAVAAGLAHEINNPLASIVACADGLQRRLGNGRPDVAEQREYLQTIADEADRVREITTRLLEIARPDTAQLAPVDVAEAIRASVTLTRHRFAQRRVGLLQRVDPDVPRVQGSGQELRQVLLNLLGNALDASPAEADVVVRLHRNGSEVLLDVEDRGAGIPADMVDRIFDPFFTTKDVGKGTGLGLAIVQRIVERHRGNVEVTALDPGTRFRVRLPAEAD